MQDEVLDVTIHLGEEASITVHLRYTHGEGVTLTVEVTVNPVVAIEDILTRLCDVLDVVRHLHVEPEAISDTVPSFCLVDILNRTQENSSVRFHLAGILKEMEVEAAADRADTILIELVLSSLVATAVGISCAFSQAVARGSRRSIDATTAECCGNRERVSSDGLNPTDVALVVVQLIADTAVGQVFVSHYGCSNVVAPLLGDVVVVGGTHLSQVTIAVRILVVRLNVNGLHVATITSDVVAGAVGEVERTAIGDSQTVHDVGASTCPTYDAAATGGSFAQEGNLCQTVLDGCSTITLGNDTAVGAIAHNRAIDSDINIASADSTVVDCNDTCCELLVRSNGTLHLQVLDESTKASVVEQCQVICTFRE